MRRIARIAGAALVVVGSLTIVATPAAGSATLTGSQFVAGNIISDSTFYNSKTMNAASVQAFLNARYTGCDSGYTCMRDYRTATTNQPAESGLCAGYTGLSSETAAAIIAKVAVSCGVNPQSLLVLAEKESGVVTSPSPSYTTAMGYGCPDSTGCNSRYYGFFNQVWLAARQFKLYRQSPTNYGYVAGQNNYILYNPNTACGGSTVFIQNQATAGLYDYTPYQPNAAALANLHGTGNSCSAYGNRNFWVFFNTWFGAATGPSVNIPYDGGGLFALKPDGSADVWRNSESTTAPFKTSTSTTVSTAGTWSAYQTVATGDVNGDGLPDVIATKSDGSMWLAINTGGSAPYGAPIQISPANTWSAYNRIIAADVNGDGKSDLLATKSDGSMYLFMNSGGSTPFGSGTQISAAPAWKYYTTIVAGDANRDGKTDLLAERADGSMNYFPNSGSLTTPYLIDHQIGAVGAYSPYDSLTLLDINVDGLDDLVARKPDGTLWLQLNGGAAAFGTATQIGSGWSGYSQLLSDSVSVQRRVVTQTLIGGTSSGALYASPNVQQPVPFPSGSAVWSRGWGIYRQVVVGDVTGDHIADIVATDSSGLMWLYRGTGKATAPFGPRVQIGAGFTGWRNFVLADVNGDGHADLLATISDGSLWLFLNTGSSTKPFTLDPAHKIKIKPAGWYQYQSMGAVDLNLDHHLDLMVTTPAGGLQVYYGDGSTTAPFTTATTVSTAGWQNTMRLLAVGATSGIAGPGNILATRSDGTMWFYRNVGSTTPLLGPVQVTPTGLGTFTQVQVGNVTGHGLTDLVAVTSSGELWLSPSAGVDLFGAPSPIGSGWAGYNRIAVGDVNGDGRPDIVATNSAGQLFYFPAAASTTNPYPTGYRQTGAGSSWGGYNRILLADVTGDGRADILATTSTGAMFLYQAGTNGTQPFTSTHQSGSGYQNYTKLAAGDINGDGLADIVAIKPDGTLWRMRNVHNPLTPMGTAAQIGTGFGGYNRIELGDVEGLGRADLIATKSDGSLWICRNTGNSAAPFPGCVPSTTTNWAQFGLFGLP